MAGQEPTKEPIGQDPIDPTVEPQVDPVSAPDAPVEPSAEPKTFSQEYVSGLRNEAAGYRTKLKELEEWKAEQERQNMSDLEKAQADAKAAQDLASANEQKYRATMINSAITTEAAKQGFPVEAALKLADGVEIDSDGNVTGAADAVAKLVGDYPGMVNGGSTGASMNGSRAKKKTLLTKAEIESKSEAWILANEDLVNESLANL